MDKDTEQLFDPTPIRVAVVKSQLTKEEAAKICNLSPVTFGKFYNGKSMTLDKFFEAASKLNLKPVITFEEAA
jgi:hypothetical protein